MGLVLVVLRSRVLVVPSSSSPRLAVFDFLASYKALRNGQNQMENWLSSLSAHFGTSMQVQRRVEGHVLAFVEEQRGLVQQVQGLVERDSSGTTSHGARKTHTVCQQSVVSAAPSRAGDVVNFGANPSLSALPFHSSSFTSRVSVAGGLRKVFGSRSAAEFLQYSFFKR